MGEKNIPLEKKGKAPRGQKLERPCIDKTANRSMGRIIHQCLKCIWEDAGMKRDCELPWYLRVARWAVVLLGIVYGCGFVAHSFKEWFGL